MKAVEKMGLLKMDFLGLTTLTVIDDCAEAHPSAIVASRSIWRRSPLDDAETYEKVFHRALTSGVFQFESGGMRDVLRRYKPTSVEDLTALNALYRPGPIQGGMIDDFIERKWGRRKVEYELPELEALLKETLGVIVYQEQVMQIANVLAGYSLGEADLLRRAMGKKNPEEMAKQRERFVEGAVERKHPKDKVTQHFRPDGAICRLRLQQVALRGVCAAGVSHGISEDALSGGVHGGAADSEISKPENVVKYIKECREMGIPSSRRMCRSRDADFTRMATAIRFGLTAIKNVGRNAIDSILAARANWQEQEKRISLILGVLREGRSASDEQTRHRIADQGGRARLLRAARAAHGAVDRAMERAQKTQRDLAAGQHGLFAGLGGDFRRRSRQGRIRQWARTMSCQTFPTGMRTSVCNRRRKCSASSSPAIRWISMRRSCATSSVSTRRRARDEARAATDRRRGAATGERRWPSPA